MKRKLSVIAIFALLLSGVATSPASASSCLAITGTQVTGPGTCNGAITIPADITSIQSEAFESNGNLTSVTFAPNSRLVSIGDEAFAGSSLQSISFGPNSLLETIGREAFSNTGLALVDFGANSRLRTIGDSAFYGAYNLISISIPDSVVSIGESAFSDNAALGSVFFGSSSQLETIGDGAFYGARALTSISIPESVITIGDYAFGDTQNLTYVNFSANAQLETIGEGAFYEASSLLDLAIPDSVVSIGPLAFFEASALTSVSFGLMSELTTIGGQAFDGASSLALIELPSSLSSIGAGAFKDATSLQAVAFLGPAPSVLVGPAPSVLGGDITNIAGARALVGRTYIGTGTGKFGTVGSNWNGLLVEVLDATLSLNSAGNVTTLRVEFGAAPSTPQPTRSGFTLAGWSTTQGSTAQFAADLSDFIMGSQAQTLFAVWQEVPAQAQSASEELAHPFAGPLLLNLNRSNFEANLSSTLTFQGVRLNRIDSVLLDGKRLEIISKSRSNITLALPAMALGSYTLVIESKSGRLALSRFIVVR